MRKRKKTYYDPDPGRRRTRRRRTRDPRRRGKVPKQLRAWVFGRRLTRDPGYRYSLRSGPRGGHYFIGPKKRRYDPARKRRFGRAWLTAPARRVGSQLERGFNRYASWIGGLLALAAGVWMGYDSMKNYGPNQANNYLHSLIGGDIKDASGTLISTRGPEIAHLWSLDQSKDAYYLPNYLKYKFLGLDPNTNQYVGSAWVIPFWASIAAFIFSKLPLGPKLKRIQRPIGAIGKAGAIVSTIGALAIPGSDGSAQVIYAPTGAQAFGSVPFPRGQSALVV
jgi:hypothetical protein